jgi:hypothetical protein
VDRLAGGRGPSSPLARRDSFWPEVPALGLAPRVVGRVFRFTPAGYCAPYPPPPPTNTSHVGLELLRHIRQAATGEEEE